MARRLHFLESAQEKALNGKYLPLPLRRYIAAQVVIRRLSEEDEALHYLGAAPSVLYQVMKQCKMTWDKKRRIWRFYANHTPSKYPILSDYLPEGMTQ